MQRRAAQFHFMFAKKSTQLTFANKKAQLQR
jgi:hypothetical protein